MGPGEEFSFQKETGEKVPVTVKAFKSTDEGVAFLIEAEGKVLYHAGDLNNWVWEGEPEEYNFRMSEAFHSELLKILMWLLCCWIPGRERTFIWEWMILCIWWELILCFPCISGEILA